MQTANMESKDTTCSVCHELFKQPKILPCAHELCRDCLVSWLQAEKDAECPLCKSVITDAKEVESNNYEAFADRLPTDFALAAVLESANMLGEKHMCRVCEEVTAVALCMECWDMLCTSCVRVHGKLSATRHHVVKDLEKLTPEFLAANRSAKCPNHESELAKLYCVKHEERICQLCVMTAHDSCSRIASFGDKVEKARQSLVEFDAQMNAVELKMLDEINRTEEKIKQINQKVEDAFNEIDSTCERLTKSLEEGRKRLRDLVQDSGEKLKTDVDNVKTKLSHTLGKVSLHRQIAKRVKDAAPCTAILDMTAMLQKRISTLQVTDKIEPGAIITFDSERLGHFEEDIQDLRKLVNAHVTFRRSYIIFHTKCGPQVKLSPTCQFATTKQSVLNGASLVFSSEALKVNHLYEIRVESMNWKSKRFIAGITVKSPESLESLPKCIEELTSSLLITFDCILTYGKKTRSNYGRALIDLEQGSHVGVLVDSSSCLHLYFNGVDQGVAHCDVQQPCWAVFDLCDLTRISGLQQATFNWSSNSFLTR